MGSFAVRRAGNAPDSPMMSTRPGGARSSTSDQYHVVQEEARIASQSLAAPLSAL